MSHTVRFALAAFLACPGLFAQTVSPPAPAGNAETRAAEIQQLRLELARLSARLDALEHAPAPAAPEGVLDSSSQPASHANPTSGPNATLSPTPPSVDSTASSSAAAGTPGPAVAAQTAPTTASAAPPPQATGLGAVVPTALPGGATLNYTFDGYYEYNFNQPPGRVNDLRAYDVLSNTFSINQASLVYELTPDLEQHRRLGLRLDLQFGQATETLQGNPANELRPEVYRNLFQAYGTFVAPVGKGLTLDFGKWASSLGVEGNYTKDQNNYTRSYYFYFLPFYHQGLRAGYQVNDKLKLNYWIVNGANQSEPTNGFKDELFGFVLTPTKKITWTSNYYFGQEHPDSAAASNCSMPVQPGLCVQAISPAPNGKLHIFDNYVTWQVTPKLALTGEGDYVIQRLWATAGPGESSAPSHVSGGAAYAQYQLNPHASLAGRMEYMSDRNGLFSNASQALKEFTGTYKVTLTDGLDAFFEYRRDWTNIPYFTTHTLNGPSGHQQTATLGLVWWYGGKQGTW